MLKKLMLPILIISIAIQLLVPVGMIVYGNKAEEDFLKHGKEFRIPVYIQSFYDGSVDVRFYDYNLYRIGTYAVMEEDEEGFANLSTIVEAKPKTPDYISVTWENKEKLAGFTIDSDFSSSRVNEESAYLVIKVYNGDFEVVGLYMDGIPAEEWVQTAEPTTYTWEDDLFG